MILLPPVPPPQPPTAPVVLAPARVDFSSLVHLAPPWADPASRRKLDIPVPRRVELDLKPYSRNWVNPWVDFVTVLGLQALTGGRGWLLVKESPWIPQPAGNWRWERYPMEGSILVLRDEAPVRPEWMQP